MHPIYGKWWFNCGEIGFYGIYPLVVTNIATERSTMLLMGKLTISTGSFSIAILNHQRVCLWKNMLGKKTHWIKLDGLKKCANHSKSVWKKKRLDVSDAATSSSSRDHFRYQRANGNHTSCDLVPASRLDQPGLNPNLRPGAQRQISKQYPAVTVYITNGKIHHFDGTTTTISTGPFWVAILT